MKLYTEEQVLKMMELARFTYNSEDKILLSQTPIELPSDEEIESSRRTGTHDFYNDGFEHGAKWMRDKITITQQTYGEWMRSNPPIPQQTDKEKQKKLLTEIMNDDAQDGLYDHVPNVRKKVVTAVEWLIEQISEKQPNGFYVIDTLEDVVRVFEQAKQMEKEQLKGMYNEGAFAQMRYFDGKEFLTFDQYYNETYGG